MNKFNEKGERHGYWEETYFKDVIWYKGNYINGEPVGCWEVFSAFGEITDKAFFL